MDMQDLKINLKFQQGSAGSMQSETGWTLADNSGTCVDSEDEGHHFVNAEVFMQRLNESKQQEVTQLSLNHSNFHGILAKFHIGFPVGSPSVSPGLLRLRRNLWTWRVCSVFVISKRFALFQNDRLHFTPSSRLADTPARSDVRSPTSARESVIAIRCVRHRNRPRNADRVIIEMAKL